MRSIAKRLGVECHRPISTFLSVCAVLCFFALPSSFAAEANFVDIMKSMDKLVGGKATPYDRAVLYKNNAAINRAAMNGWLSDVQYQRTQSDFSIINQNIAKHAAADAGAEFTVQTRTSKKYSPGTDSDYITKVKSEAQIAKMQQSYNRRINGYLERHGLSDGARNDWHNSLDTDFMADPSEMSEAQFKRISKMNNDAYKRRLAADYERIVRSNQKLKEAIAEGTTPAGAAPEILRPEHFTEYAQEMKDLQAKKAALIEKMTANRRAIESNTDLNSRLKILMAQEQKYISRIEATIKNLRAQEGLPALDPNAGPSLAQRGSKRARSNYGVIEHAHSMSETSLNKALRQLSESIAEAAERNPKTFNAANAAKDISILTRNMPELERQALLKQMKNRFSPEFHKMVTEEIGKRPAFVKSAPVAEPTGPTVRDRVRGLKERAQAMDAKLQRSLGVSDDLSGMGARRAKYNRKADKAMKRLGKVALVATGYAIAQYATTYFTSMRNAMDPNISDEQKEQYYAEAYQAAMGVAHLGGAGVLMEMFPTVGAAYIAYTLSNEAGMWIVRETETGQALNSWTAEFMDDQFKALEAGTNQRLDNMDWDIYWKFSNALYDGRLRPRGDLTFEQALRKIREFIKAGHYHRILKEAVEQVKPGDDLKDVLDEDKLKKKAPLGSQVLFVVDMEGSGYTFTSAAEGDVRAIRVTGQETFVIPVPRDQDPKQILEEVRQELRKVPECIPAEWSSPGVNEPPDVYDQGPQFTIRNHPNPFLTQAEIDEAESKGEIEIGEAAWEADWDDERIWNNWYCKG